MTTTTQGRAFVIGRLRRAADLAALARIWDSIADAYKADNEVKAAKLAVEKRLR